MDKSVRSYLREKGNTVLTSVLCLKKLRRFRFWSLKLVVVGVKGPVCGVTEGRTVCFLP